MANINRRLFLKGAGATGFLGGTGALAGLSAAGAYADTDLSGYKALVCVFLKGGLDHADTVLPYDQPSYDQLKTTRENLFNAHGSDDPSSPRHRDSLLPLSPLNDVNLDGRVLALPSQLEGLRTLFHAEEAAIVGSVGPLITPLTREDYEDRLLPIPSRLFSHNDQQSTWMAMGTEGARHGWGGKFADAVLAADPSADPLFTAITASSNDVWLAGTNTRQFRVSHNGASTLDVVNQRWRMGYGSSADAARAALREHYLRADFGSENVYSRDFSAAMARAVENNQRFDQALDLAPPFNTVFPETSIGRQFQAVANTINLRSVLGTPRQIFYVTMGGYDTHSNQANAILNLHQQLNDAMLAFRNAMVEVEAWNDTCVFTASDFGRTLIDNGDGTDHGWAGHHFVAGGSVRGKRIFGQLPDSDLESRFYTSSRGRLIPQVSVDQYAATLGRWFGLDEVALDRTFPNLGNFSSRHLNFLPS